jgi:hypothetical protein
LISFTANLSQRTMPATTRGEGMTDSPPSGEALSTSRNNLALNLCHNFSPHRHARVRGWCAANAVELVFLPTYGSWLNWIEAEFAALRNFALNGTDHRSHEEQNAAIAAYVRWRNARAKPKTNFAVGSPIRTWTSYPVKAA